MHCMRIKALKNTQHFRHALVLNNLFLSIQWISVFNEKQKAAIYLEAFFSQKKILIILNCFQIVCFRMMYRNRFLKKKSLIPFDKEGLFSLSNFVSFCSIHFIGLTFFFFFLSKWPLLSVFSPFVYVNCLTPSSDGNSELPNNISKIFTQVSLILYMINKSCQITYLKFTILLTFVESLKVCQFALSKTKSKKIM